MATVLVVDDRPINREFLRTLLSYANHRILEAGDGEEALNVARKEHPHLIIVDIIMPTMDGFEFVQALRKDSSIGETPVIFYSATYREKEAKAVAEQCGVLHVLMKPAEPEVILETVSNILGETVPQPSTDMHPGHPADLGLLTDVLQDTLSETRRVVARLAGVIELNLSLATKKELNALLQTFSRGAREIVTCGFACVGILGEQSQALEEFHIDGVGFNSAARFGKLLLNSGNIPSIVQQRTPTRIFSESKLSPLMFAGDMFLTHSFLGVPILDRDHVIGFLCFADKIGSSHFSYEDERLAVTLAAQLSVFYENAVLHSTLEKHARELENEIHSRNQAEELLNRLSNAVEQSGDSVVITDRDGRIEYVNPTFEKLTGFSKAETIGKTPRILKSGLYDQKFYQSMWKTILSGEIFRFQFTNRKKSGELFIEEQTIAPIRKKDGEITHFVSTGKDTTERDKAEKAYQAQNAVTRVLAESSTLADAAPRLLKLLCETSRSDFASLWICDSKPKTLHCIDTYHVNHSRYTEFDVKTRAKTVAPGSKGMLGTVWQTREPIWVANIQTFDEFERATAAEAAGIRSAFVFPAITKTGAVAIIELFSSEFRERDQGLVEMFSSIGVQIGQFIERKQSEEANLVLERQLLHSQKMEAVGQLAGGVAHDFNNLLMAMGSYLELLTMQIAPDHPASKIASEIRMITDQGSNLTRQLLAFSRNQVLSPKIIDLNQTITKIREMLCMLAGENIHVMTNLSGKAANVKADPGQVEQLIMNISVNAKDAMPHGGVLTIETENVELGQKDFTEGLDAVPGPYVRLRITDTGAGMDQETLSRIFEPFFTTKDEGKGTGLGLSTVYGIVRQSGGQISVNSKPGTGTTFQVYFPRVQETTEDKDLFANEHANLNGHGESVLLVDDNHAIRNAMGELLQLKGYRVHSATNGLEALDIVKNQLDKVEILISDLIMPGISGQDLSSRLRETFPRLKVLYMSGYTEEALKNERALDRDTRFVSKPIGIQHLLSVIRELLEGSQK